MEEYLTTEELSRRIKMASGTIRNLVWKRELREKIHYLKPTPRKLLFIWSAVEAWLQGNPYPSKGDQDIKSQDKCLINIYK